MAEAWTLEVRGGVGNLVFNHPDGDVNILTSAHLTSLDRALDGLASRSDLTALLFTSAKPRIFIAGADIREIEGITDPKDAFRKAEEGKAIFAKIEALKFPTVCVINGACLGGGTELALACRYRVASFSPNVKIGLPEVNLGILPGFGGSIRLPRLLGLTAALPLLLAGKIVSAEEALKIGLVDRLFPEQTLVDGAYALAAEAAAGRPVRKPAKKKWMTVFLEDTPPGRALVFSRAKKDVLKRTKGHYPAPVEILKLVSRTWGRRGAEPFRLESEHFARLGATDVSKNLIQVFFLTEKYKKTRWTSAPAVSDGVRKCGVVGAGVMGGGIAQLVSARDIPVRVKDLNDKALSGALKEASSIYRGALKRRKLRPWQVESKMALISTGLTNAGLKTCDVIIEAVIEDLGVKQKVFRELGDLTDPSTVLASNTSSLPVTKMAEACRNPERVVGLHFFNPVDRMPLVEVIRGARSSPEAIERTVLFARRLGKTAILVEDRPGFLVNRLLLPYMNEAAYLLSEGVEPARVDAVAEGFGMPMGPVELADQVGIDVGHKVAHVLEEAFGPRMKVAPILEEARKKGLLGKKSGKGFYVYDGKKKAPNPELRPSKASGVSDEDARKRMLYIMINEAARCLEEKVVDSADTVDIGMMMGAGFPPFRGGLLRWADSVGAAAVVKDLERFQKEVDAARFEPSAYLRDLAARGKSFHS
ncbi:MAG TPA: 3-hydroxyacyl-CoA dehydrogenase NAD-binding domain-containing protein [Candidatus Eisenbacteria bacterium]|nr:3-hydroxyacyl-CoA dehydrogenase NAD-binding domain-containing protein [Candidatus Eisenbacteria bacterium]